MAMNRVQFDRGLSLPQFLQLCGTEEQYVPEYVQLQVRHQLAVMGDAARAVFANSEVTYRRAKDGIPIEQAIEEVRELDQWRQTSGLDQAALDEAARKGGANDRLEELEEDLPEMVEEFYLEAAGEEGGNSLAASLGSKPVAWRRAGGRSRAAGDASARSSQGR